MVDKKIFIDAEFGDKYVTSDGRIALFSHHCYDPTLDFGFCIVYLDESFCELTVNYDGDIINWNDLHQQWFSDDSENDLGFIVSKYEA